MTLTIAASAALAVYVTSTTSALGISSAIFAASGLVMFEIAVRGTKDDNEGGTRGLMSADGSFSRRGSVSSNRKIQELAAFRDVAAAISVICAIATYMIEPSVAPGAATWEPLYREFNRDTYVRGRETFDRTWAEVKELILGAWWRDLQMEQAGQEKANG